MYSAAVFVLCALVAVPAIRADDPLPDNGSDVGNDTTFGAGHLPPGNK